ncbi:hypothetical protein MNBD_GAMMA26-427 [hydrothermal vent metagenome]|uniref:Periplasmic protein n=1 Tax=hydrothermal vent metagenome TaxID=652676 RepID=A0A3B1BKC5_9ZZZZ
MIDRTAWVQVAAILLLYSFGTPLFAGDAPLTYDRINLSANASDEVENDTLVVQLYAQEEGRNAAHLAKQVNQDVAWAVKRAKGQPGIKVQTLDYRTSPTYRKQERSGWRVRQSLRLESQDAVGLSQLLGELQQRLAVGNISYKVSPDRRKEAEAQLISRAIGAFKERARLIADELGQPAYRLVRMDVNTSGRGMQPRMMRAEAMYMEGKMQAPSLEAGTQMVQVTVNGTIELKD